MGTAEATAQYTSAIKDVCRGIPPGDRRLVIEFALVVYRLSTLSADERASTIFTYDACLAGYVERGVATDSVVGPAIIGVCRAAEILQEDACYAYNNEGM